MFDAWKSGVAVLAADGTIEMVNEAWERFAVDNGGAWDAIGVGVNHVAVCQFSAASEPGGWRRRWADSDRYSQASRPNALKPCHAPGEQRWFRLNARPLTVHGVTWLLVVHGNVSDRTRLQQTAASAHVPAGTYSAGDERRALVPGIDVSVGRFRSTDVWNVLRPCWRRSRSGWWQMLGVEPGRVLRVAKAFAAQPSGPPEVRLCTVASKLLHAAGVAVSVDASGETDSRTLLTVCATDGVRAGETRQFDLGEGPSYTAHRTGRPVQVADLECDDTWPVFAKAATVLGFRAVFAFPLQSGSHSIGALTLYYRVAGELTAEQHADALAVARFALNLLTSLQAGHPPDELDQVFDDGMARTEKISQASGMVAVQLGISVNAALAVLRAEAFAGQHSLAEVATQVVEHRLTLDRLPD